MLTIVNLYKTIIYVMVWLTVLAVIAIFFLAGMVINNHPEYQPFLPLIIFVGISLLVAIILSLGLTATFISMHDRHKQIASEIMMIRKAVETYVNQVAPKAEGGASTPNETAENYQKLPKWKQPPDKIEITLLLVLVLIVMVFFGTFLGRNG